MTIREIRTFNSKIRKLERLSEQYLNSKIKIEIENKKLKQKLKNTRKALEIAVDMLKRIDETRSGVKENLHATNGRTLNAGNIFCWATMDDIHNAIKAITALEQKDVK